MMRRHSGVLALAAALAAAQAVAPAGRAASPWGAAPTEGPAQSAWGAQRPATAPFSPACGVAPSGDPAELRREQAAKQRFDAALAQLAPMASDGQQAAVEQRLKQELQQAGIGLSQNAVAGLAAGLGKGGAAGMAVALAVATLIAEPEAGDEVVVGFEQGDPSSPIVLGQLWNGCAAPPASSADLQQVASLPPGARASALIGLLRRRKG